MGAVSLTEIIRQGEVKQIENKIFQSRVCVCAHLTQTRYAQKNVRRNVENMQKNIYVSEIPILMDIILKPAVVSM